MVAEDTLTQLTNKLEVVKKQRANARRTKTKLINEGKKTSREYKKAEETEEKHNAEIKELEDKIKEEEEKIF